MHKAHGDILIFLYIRNIRVIFWVLNFEFQYFLVFRKMNIFVGSMKILWIFFFWGGGGVITKLDYI